jgi:hypothetical protein
MAAYSAVARNRSNMGNGSYLDIFCQNVRSSRTKSVEIVVTRSDLSILKLYVYQKTYLNESFASKKFSPKFMLYIILIEIVILNYLAEDSF